MDEKTLAICKHCRKVVYKREGWDTWFHTLTRVALCEPTRAEPAPTLNREEVDRLNAAVESGRN